MTDTKIAKSLNLAFHGGNPVRTAKKVTDRRYSLRTGKAGDGVPRDTSRQEQVWTADGATVATGSRAYSIEEMAEMFEVDMDTWRPVKRITNVWAKNTQTKVWWELIELNVLATLWDEFLETVSMPPPKDPVPARAGETFYEIAMFDAHLGMLAWGQEAGEDYDLNIGLDQYREAFRYLLDTVPDHAAYILWPIGQDLFHFDTLIKGKSGATAAGTPQDVDSRWMKLFVEVAAVHTELVSLALSKGFRIKLVVQPGNHDTQTSFYLGEYLQAYFRSNVGVEVDNSPRPRKYHKDGEVTIGFTHGHREKADKLYRLIMEENRQHTKVMEWHRGHKHQEDVFEDGRVVVRGLRAMSPGDAWHAEEGWPANVGAHGFLWNTDVGALAAQVYWVPGLTQTGGEE
jgi:hypothetical protein